MKTGKAQKRNRSKVSVLTVILLFCLAASSIVGAQQSDFLKLTKKSHVIPGPLPISINAAGLSIDGKKEIYTARGDVTVTVGNRRLRADSVVINLKNKTGTAKGGVIVREGSDVLEADSFTFNMAEGTAVLYNGKVLWSQHNVYLDGKKLEKIGDYEYKIEQGSFTTCDGATPDWRITARNVNVVLKGYSTVKHGFFYIKDIPVLYIPWLIYPSRQQRKTGLLIPSVSSSTQKGFDIRFPLFLNISPSLDATVTGRVCTKRALQGTLEFRYFPYEDLKGRFYGEYTNDWNFITETGPKRHRFYLTLRHDQTFPAKLRLKANGTWLSDRDYFEFWGGRFDRRKRVRYLESNAVLDRQWNNFLFQAEARHFDNLDVPDNAVTVQNIPIVSGTAFNQKIPYTPFYFSSNLVFSHFFAAYMDDQWFGSRLKMDARLGLPIALGRYLKLAPSMTFLPKAYSASYFENDQSTRSVNAIRTDLYQVNTDVFTDLQSVYGSPILGFQRIRHTIRPRVGWVYRPAVEQKLYPIFDDSDRTDRVSLLTAEIRQTLTGRLAHGRYLDFMTLSVSQGYDFYGSRAPEDPLGTRAPFQYRLTNTQAEFTLKPHSIVDLVAQAEYDPVLNRARRYSLNLGLMDHRGDMLRVVHQFSEDENKRDLNRQTNVNMQVKLTPSLACFFENQYSHQFDFSYLTSFGLEYRPQCWSLALKYSEARELDPLSREIRETDRTVFMTVSLGWLGPVYSMARDWRDIMGQTPRQDASNDL
jgi:LPS-assembly protein